MKPHKVFKLISKSPNPPYPKPFNKTPRQLRIQQLYSNTSINFSKLLLNQNKLKTQNFFKTKYFVIKNTPNFKSQFTTKYNAFTNSTHTFLITKFTYKKIIFYLIIFSFIFYIWQSLKKLFLLDKDQKDNPIIENSKKLIQEVLVCDEIKASALELVERIAKNEYTFQAIKILLVDLLENPFIMEETEKYGRSIFEKVLQDDIIKAELKRITIELLETDEVKKESVEVFKHVINKNESQDILTQYFKVLFLRLDMIKAFSSLVEDGVVHTMNSEPTRDKLENFLIDVWSDSSLRWNLIKKTLSK